MLYRKEKRVIRILRYVPLISKKRLKKIKKLGGSKLNINPKNTAN